MAIAIYFFRWTNWIHGASELDKRPQLSVFGDGEQRVKPLIMFRGTGARIPLAETVRYVYTFYSCTFIFENYVVIIIITSHLC